LFPISEYQQRQQQQQRETLSTIVRESLHFIHESNSLALVHSLTPLALQQKSTSSRAGKDLDGNLIYITRWEESKTVVITNMLNAKRL
jgi:hypothetical protein